MKSVLIVDDEQDVTRHLARAFECKGFEAVTAVDGEEGIAVYSTKRFDFILLDLFLPKKDGLEILNELKKIDGDVKALMVTAEESKVFIDKARAAGACGYVVKPFGVEQITALVELFSNWKGDEEFFIIGGIGHGN